jgi:RNA polymerase sigma-70 factor (ECF subfamily)
MVDAKTERDRADGEDLAIFAAAPDSTRGRAAAGRLLKRYQGRVYGFCFRHVRDHELALDLTQDVLLNAYRRLREYEHRTGFAAWLFTIARNRCLSEFRKRPLPTVRDLDPDQLTTAGPDPIEELAEQDLHRLVKDCLDQTEQDALHLRCHEGLPVDTITEVLGITSASGARGILQRARRKLRAALGDFGGIDEGAEVG